MLREMLTAKGFVDLSDDDDTTHKVFSYKQPHLLAPGQDDDEIFLIYDLDDSGTIIDWDISVNDMSTVDTGKDIASLLAWFNHPDNALPLTLVQL